MAKVELLTYPPLYNMKEKSTEQYSQWSVRSNGEFLPTFQTVDKLPSGYYELSYDNSANSAKLSKKTTSTDELFNLPTIEISSIINDLETFWESKGKYTEFNLIHKRGILLWGDPGCGKSGIISLCCDYVIDKKDGVVINLKDYEDVEKSAR